MCTNSFSLIPLDVFFFFFSSTITSSNSPREAKKSREQQKQQQQQKQQEHQQQQGPTQQQQQQHHLPTQDEIEENNSIENELTEIKVPDINPTKERIVVSVDKVVSANLLNIESVKESKEQIPTKVSTFSLVNDYSSSSNESD